MSKANTLPVGTRLKILPPRNDAGHKIKDTWAITGLLGTVVDPLPGQVENTEYKVHVEIDDLRRRFYLATDRLMLVRPAVARREWKDLVYG